MTTNHTELCERLHTYERDFRLDLMARGDIEEARRLIESQVASIQQQAARIAELDRKHKEAWDDCGELNTANHELIAACVEKDGRIAELEKERDALKADAETYRALKAGAHPSYNAIVSLNGHSLYLEKKELVTVLFESWAALESALQAEKETK